jgi:hypothetical protein
MHANNEFFMAAMDQLQPLNAAKQNKGVVDSSSSNEGSA